MEYNNIIRHLMFNIMTMVVFVRRVCCLSRLDHPPPALFHCQRRRDGFLHVCRLLYYYYCYYSILYRRIDRIILINIMYAYIMLQRRVLRLDCIIGNDIQDDDVLSLVK